MSIQVNDILVSKFGYNCSLVTFYKVIDKTKSGKSLKLIQVKNKFTHSDIYGQQGMTIPSDEVVNKPFTKRIIQSKYCDEEYVRINTYETARLWNNKPVWYDSYD